MTDVSRIKGPYAIQRVAGYQPIFVGWIAATTLRSHVAEKALHVARKVGTPTPKNPLNVDKFVAILMRRYGAYLPKLYRYRARLKSTVPAIEATVPARHAADASTSSKSSISRAEPLPKLSFALAPGLRKRFTPLTSSELLKALRKLDDGLRPAKGHSAGRAGQGVAVTLADPATRLTNWRSAFAAFQEALADAGVVGMAMPTDLIQLSPLGMLHIFRSIYHDVGQGYGPLEQVFTLAPGETVDVVQETFRRQTLERTEETGEETFRQSTEEAKSLDEVSDETSRSLRRDSRTAIGANAGVSLPIFSLGASFSSDVSSSQEEATRRTTKATRETIQKSVQEVRASHKLTVKSTLETTERSSMSRRIQNAPGSKPANYGLRRVIRKIRVTTQYLGPQLCYSTYIQFPGERLAISRLTMFREAEALAIPEIPPGAPPPPAPIQDRSTQTLHFVSTNPAGTQLNYEFPVPEKPGRTIMGGRLESAEDADPGKHPDPVAIVGTPQYDANTKRLLFTTASPGVADVTATVTVSYSADPSELEAWKRIVEGIRQEIKEKYLDQQFEQHRRILQAKSAVRPRPALDLRREERYEVYARMLANLKLVDYSVSDKPPIPLSPPSMEALQALFDIDSMFYYVFPWWWSRSSAQRREVVGLGSPDRAEYEITEETEPAPLGRSLGWVIQLDGDRRRNEFLNSPWVRACFPVWPGKEDAAIEFLRRYVEGALDLQEMKPPPPTPPAPPTEPPPLPDWLKLLLADLGKRRADEKALEKAGAGPDWLLDELTKPTASQELECVPRSESALDAPSGRKTAKPPEASPPAALPDPKCVYPVKDVTDIVQPTEGFVYDALTVVP